MPDLENCVLTLDAKHNVKETFEKIVDEKHGEFFICIKKNAETLRRYMSKCFDENPDEIRRAETLDRGHGRIEKRSIEVLPISPSESGWPHTHVGCRITRIRKIVRKNIVIHESEEQTFYAGSMNAFSRSPEEFLKLSRGHWTIENNLHYHKDRSLDEDRNPASEHGSGRIMCYLRSVAALVLGKAKESINHIKFRLAIKPHLLMGLLTCNDLSQWIKK